MKKVFVTTLVALVALCGILLAIPWTRPSRMKQTKLNSVSAQSQAVGIAKSDEAKRIQQLNDAEDDPNVIRSILHDLKLSLEIQPQWKQDKQFLIEVHLEKPLGKRYLVDAIDQSCVLYVNRRPRVLLRQHGPPGDPRKLLEENNGSFHPLFRIAPDIPDNSELMVEWVSYNSRTKQIERLRTEPYVWGR